MALVKDRDQLTKAENKICDYIEEYMNNSIYMTVTEIANGCGVGEATVTRFCRKLGFRSFLEFKMTMAQEFKNGAMGDENLDNINLNEDSIESLAKQMYDTNISFLESSFKGLNYKELEEITGSISNAKKVYFVGVGHSGIIAEESYYKFMRIGIDCNCFRDAHTIVMMSPLMKEGDVMFVISHSGNTSEINIAVEIAKKNGVNIIALTENLMSKLARISDYIINYVSPETKVETGSITSKISQAFIIDLIYSNVLRKNYDYTMSTKKKTTDAMETLSKL